MVVQMVMARVTCAAAMAARTADHWPDSSGNVRWQWESVNMEQLRQHQTQGRCHAGGIGKERKLKDGGCRRPYCAAPAPALPQLRWSA